MKKTISEYIRKELIEKKKMSKADLARELGISAPSVLRYLTGNQEPSEETCVKLAKLIAGDNYMEELQRILLLKGYVKAKKEGHSPEVQKAYLEMLKKVANLGIIALMAGWFTAATPIPANASLNTNCASNNRSVDIMSSRKTRRRSRVGVPVKVLS